MDAGVQDYFDFLHKGLADSGPFTPKPFYDPEGDTLFFYAIDVPSYAKRLNPLLTLILSSEDQSLVGCRIKGIRRMLTRMQRLGWDKYVIDERAPGIRLTIFVELALVTPPDDPAMAEYEGAIAQYDDVVIDARELQLN